MRKTNRGEVRINGGVYFLDALRDFHSEEIRVAWDYRDTGSVGIFTLEGEHIGDALLDGNATPAMPATMIQRAAEKREKGQLNRLVQKARVVTGSDVEIRAITPAASYSDEKQAAAGRAYAQQLADQGTRFQIPHNKMERYRLWKKLDGQLLQGEEVPEAARDWHERYKNHSDLKAIAKVMDAEMDAGGRQPTRTRRAV